MSSRRGVGGDEVDIEGEDCVVTVARGHVPGDSLAGDDGPLVQSIGGAEGAGLGEDMARARLTFWMSTSVPSLPSTGRLSRNI